MNGDIITYQRENSIAKYPYVHILMMIAYESNQYGLVSRIKNQRFVSNVVDGHRQVHVDEE